MVIYLVHAGSIFIYLMDADSKVIYLIHAGTVGLS
jgi:hypothetical protein